MNKEYFPHDYNSKLDYKIVKLRAKHGMAGYGVYWAIVEEIYAHRNRLPKDISVLSFIIGVDEPLIESVLNDFDLFQIEGDYITSRSIAKRLEIREQKSEKYKTNAQKRWQNNAIAMQLHSENDTMADKVKDKVKVKVKDKVKDKEKLNIKLNTNIESNFKNWTTHNFKDSIKEIYNSGKIHMPKEEWLNFYEYWSEMSPAGKFRFQLEKTWSTELRLNRWSKADFKKPKPEDKTLDALNSTLNKIINDEY